LTPLGYDELNEIAIAREPIRTTQAVLELELAERDEEIKALRTTLSTLKERQKVVMGIISELNLDPVTLEANNEISSVTNKQLYALLELLAQEREMRTAAELKINNNVHSNK
jgi:hypothetical protein